MMRLMVMFDLPVETSKQRREYRKFHKRLIQEGFYGIYDIQFTREYALVGSQLISWSSESKLFCLTRE